MVRELDETVLKKYTVVKLRSLLKEANLPTSGTKPFLVNRYSEYLKKKAASQPITLTSQPITPIITNAPIFPATPNNQPNTPKEFTFGSIYGADAVNFQTPIKPNLEVAIQQHPKPDIPVPKFKNTGRKILTPVKVSNEQRFVSVVPIQNASTNTVIVPKVDDFDSSQLGKQLNNTIEYQKPVLTSVDEQTWKDLVLTDFHANLSEISKYASSIIAMIDAIQLKHDVEAIRQFTIASSMLLQLKSEQLVTISSWPRNTFTNALHHLRFGASEPDAQSVGLCCQLIELSQRANKSPVTDDAIHDLIWVTDSFREQASSVVIHAFNALELILSAGSSNSTQLLISHVISFILREPNERVLQAAFFTLAPLLKTSNNVNHLFNTNLIVEKLLFYIDNPVTNYAVMCCLVTVIKTQQERITQVLNEGFIDETVKLIQTHPLSETNEDLLFSSWEFLSNACSTSDVGTLAQLLELELFSLCTSKWAEGSARVQSEIIKVLALLFTVREKRFAIYYEVPALYSLVLHILTAEDTSDTFNALILRKNLHAFKNNLLPFITLPEESDAVTTALFELIDG